MVVVIITANVLSADEFFLEINICHVNFTSEEPSKNPEGPHGHLHVSISIRTKPGVTLYVKTPYVQTLLSSSTSQIL